MIRKICFAGIYRLDAFFYENGKLRQEFEIFEPEQEERATKKLLSRCMVLVKPPTNEVIDQWIV